MYVMIPLLSLFHLACICWSCQNTESSQDAESTQPAESASRQFLNYFRVRTSKHRDKRFERQSYVKSLKRALPASLYVGFVGALTVALYAVCPHLYDSPCIDPMLVLSVATIEVYRIPWMHYSWIAVGCLMQIAAHVLANQFYRAHGKRKKRGATVLKIMMATDDNWEYPEQKIIAQWRTNMTLGHGCVTKVRYFLYLVIHLPFAMILSIPTVFFVVGQNTPTKYAQIWVKIPVLLFQNPVTLSVSNTIFQSLLLPSMAKWLAKLKHGHDDIRDQAVCLSRTYSMFTIQILQDVVISPLVAIFLVHPLTHLPSVCCCCQHVVAASYAAVGVLLLPVSAVATSICCCYSHFHIHADGAPSTGRKLPSVLPVSGTRPLQHARVLGLSASWHRGILSQYVFTRY